MNTLPKNRAFNPRMFLLAAFISCVSFGFLISCSEKSGSARGIVIEASEQSKTIPMLAWEKFNYNTSDICQVSSSTGEISTKKGTRVEVLDEATCSQTIFNEETGESSTFATGLSKVRFPSLNNTGNASNGTFNEMWTFTSNIKIIEEKLSSIGRTEQSNSDRNRERKERKEENKFL